LNVLIGDVKEIGDAFTLHPIPRLISFTGSTKVGRQVGQLAVTGPCMKRVALELGGNAPSIILDDADVDHAVRANVVGRYLHQGQVCMSTNRLIVDAKVYDEFVDRFTAHVKSLKYGDPNDPEVAIGPIINQKQLKAPPGTYGGGTCRRREAGGGGRSRGSGVASARVRGCQKRHANRAG
jgi:aldehyde dehydrogenase (NAD+)